MFHFKLNFQDNFWLAKLSFLLEHKILNFSLQAKGNDVFAVAGKVQALTEMLKL